jgi:hypothetical protein
MPKLELTDDQLVSLLNTQFGEPHLPAGFVEAEITNDGIFLQIGPRSVHFSRKGFVHSANQDNDQPLVAVEMPISGRRGN